MKQRDATFAFTGGPASARNRRGSWAVTGSLLPRIARSHVGRMERPEISDLIVAYDPVTLARVRVVRQSVVDRFLAEGNPRAARIVSRLPARGGLLDDDAVDALLIRAHLELQRLHEEFLTARRMLRILGPLCRALSTPVKRIRIVDIGCGVGFLVRALAHSGVLGDGVELVGADLNDALVEEATALAARESLPCRFTRGDALLLEEPATIFISSSVLHHFRGDALTTFFRRQSTSGAHGFIHMDIKPSWAAPIGAWVFHEARMREPLARHDGTLSAARAHGRGALEDALRAGAPDFWRALVDAKVHVLPVLGLMHAVVGLRPAHADAFLEALGDDVEVEVSP